MPPQTQAGCHRGVDPQTIDPQNRDPLYHLGLPMWSNRQWIGSLFPKGANSKTFLQHYSSVFNTVEGNTTFYALPGEDTVASWKQQCQPGFRFCFKLPRTVTHDRALRHCQAELTEFFTRLEPLADYLGAFMIQLPERFEPGQLQDLQRFLDQLPGDYQFSVEVRHRDFFSRGESEQMLNRLLRDLQVDRVCLDSRALFSRSASCEQELNAQRKKPRLPVHAIATGTQPIVRFIGCADLSHNRQYLLPWVHKLGQWLQQGIKPTVFIHTPDNVESPEQAALFHQLLSELPGWRPLAKAIQHESRQDENQLTIF